MTLVWRHVDERARRRGFSGHNNNDCGTADASEASPGGGGAGGAIYLASDAMSLSEDALLAIGGAGVYFNSWDVYEGRSGAGGDGRIRLDYGSLNGTEWGGEDDDAETSCVPAPGWSEAI